MASLMHRFTVSVFLFKIIFFLHIKIYLLLEFHLFIKKLRL